MSDSTPSAVPTGIVQKLEAFGFDPKKVREWSAARAKTVLRITEREERIAQYRLAAAQGQATDDNPVPVPMDWERLDAAEWLEEAMARPSTLWIAVMYATGQMLPDEVRRLAEHMVKRFREPTGGRPGRLGGPTRTPAAAAAGVDGG